MKIVSKSGKMRIWAFCKDPGGAQTFGPVIKLLRQEGFSVRFFVQGKSAKHVLNRAHIFYLPYTSAQLIVDSHHCPDLILTYISESVATAKTVYQLLKRKGQNCPSLILTDYWGATASNSNETFQPDFAAVNDAVGTTILKKTWGKLPAKNIAKTGFVTLDKYAKYQSSKIRTEIRQKLKITDNKPVILFTGQLERSGEILLELTQTLNDLGVEVNLIARLHRANALQLRQYSGLLLLIDKTLHTFSR